ncbi:hypothetical protein OAG1_15840 [Agarivorans sp. OAG1]|uniref:hypothetical protein n=1 Tax=Agarivorans sp. OAG1 TaxID=3082387 RepID=UPI002B2BCE9F|nr:hypothetical protein OAG1_15840 [Agarivorans sp. OAG1]
MKLLKKLFGKTRNIDQLKAFTEANMIILGFENANSRKMTLNTVTDKMWQQLHAATKGASDALAGSYSTLWVLQYAKKIADEDGIEPYSIVFHELLLGNKATLERFPRAELIEVDRKFKSITGAA